jgi:hypothetical protein
MVGILPYADEFTKFKQALCHNPCASAGLCWQYEDGSKAPFAAESAF